MWEHPYPWTIDHAEELRAAKRIAKTKYRNTPAWKVYAREYGKVYRQRPSVRARKLEVQRAYRQRLRIS